MPYGWLSLFLSTVPYVALAVAGIVLFRRQRTAATALVAVGFIAVAASHLAAAFINYKYSYIYNTQGRVAAAEFHFEGWVWLSTYWGQIVGIWTAAAGLLWHTMVSATASPNNRWRGP